MIEEVHYNAQDAHTRLLDIGTAFHVTPNVEWFSKYSVEMSGTLRLGNG